MYTDVPGERLIDRELCVTDAEHDGRVTLDYMHLDAWQHAHRRQSARGLTGGALQA